MAQPAPAAAPRPRGMLMMFVMLFGMLFLFQSPAISSAIARYAGYVLEPVFGFGGRFPVLTIIGVGTAAVLITTVIRHFFTDWLDTAKTQAQMRAFQKELMAARKDNNTYKMKKLEAFQPEVMRMQQEMTQKQFKLMPISFLVFVPMFFWLNQFLVEHQVWSFTAPWNHAVETFGHEGIIFGTSILPHFILLYICVTIPLGNLVQKAMKYLSWKERWQERHPEVHE
jgi:uncharacterized membrane protein (DUF106 family)